MTMLIFVFLASIYQPPTAKSTSIVDPPLKGENLFTIGYGPSGSVPHTFVLKEGQNLDVGFLKLFLSTKQVELSHVVQLSPFDKQVGLSQSSARATVPAPVQTGPTPLWDTIRVPVVQRLADK